MSSTSMWSIRDYVPVPCPVHRRHDLTPLQAARVIVALTAQVGEWEQDFDECPVAIELTTHDVEGYFEHVNDLLEGIGIRDPLDDGGARDEATDG